MIYKTPLGKCKLGEGVIGINHRLEAATLVLAKRK